MHQLQGTYQPSRHANRAETVQYPTKPYTPAWLPDDVKRIYRKLAEPFASYSAIEETTLCQLAILKHQLQQDPDCFRAADHNQLRQLTVMVRQWVKEQPVVKELDDFEKWERKNQKSRAASEGQ